MVIIIFHAGKVKLVKKIKCVLQMDVVISHTMHHEKSNISLQGGCICDGGVQITVRIILRGVHVSFSVDRI